MGAWEIAARQHESINRLDGIIHVDQRHALEPRHVVADTVLGSTGEIENHCRR